MAPHSRLSVSPPPSAPPREASGQLALRAYVTLLFFVTIAHTAVFNLLGPIGAGAVLGGLFLGTVAMWVPLIVQQRPQRFAWQRLPWAPLAYVALALISALWSRWPTATLLTGALLLSITVGALFIAMALSWQEIIRSISSALKWTLGLSLLLELWAAFVVRGPILPNFSDLPEGKTDPHWYWVRANLLEGGRIQGIVGNSNALGILCLLALVVFGVLYVAKVRRRGWLVAWGALAAYLLVRAASATTYVCAVMVLVVLATVLLMRRAQRPEQRTPIYLTFAAVALGLGAIVWFARDAIFGAFGRSSDLTGRLTIWQTVLERAAQRPFAGNGFSSPWVPWAEGFDGWIVDHGITVFHAHNMWIDVYLQLGLLGLLLMVASYGSLMWRAWFFAVDRPRWDLRADRPYAPLSLLPTLIVGLLLTQGLTESGPIMLWGWMLLVLFSFKIKTVPLVGVGLSEHTNLIERGARRRRTP